MKINHGENIDISRALVFTQEGEKLILTEGDYIEVTTDGINCKTYAGIFEFNKEIFPNVQHSSVIVGGEEIRITYIKEIKLLQRN